MTQPFAFAARETPNVRGYSVGPHHVDWLCVKCGAVGCVEETGPFASRWEWQCLFEAAKQVNITRATWGSDTRARLVANGEFLLRLRSERSLFEHLQTHVRFEDILAIEGRRLPEREEKHE